MGHYYRYEVCDLEKSHIWKGPLCVDRSLKPYYDFERVLEENDFWLENTPHFEKHSWMDLRYAFTEEGLDLCKDQMENFLEYLKGNGLSYRLIKINSSDIEIICRDKNQVAFHVGSYKKAKKVTVKQVTGETIINKDLRLKIRNLNNNLTILSKIPNLIKNYKKDKVKYPKVQAILNALSYLN